MMVQLIQNKKRATGREGTNHVVDFKVEKVEEELRKSIPKNDATLKLREIPGGKINRRKIKVQRP